MSKVEKRYDYMKLNYECLRDILLYLEENLSIDDDLMFEEISLQQICLSNELSKYDNKVIYYSIYNLNEIGYISANTNHADCSVDDCGVTNITYEGHLFIESIKPESIWKDVKAKCAKIGTISIPIITQIAAQVIANLLTN